MLDFFEDTLRITRWYLDPANHKMLRDLGLAHAMNQDCAAAERYFDCADEGTGDAGSIFRIAAIRQLPTPFKRTKLVHIFLLVPPAKSASS